jgi:hypothetical protein
MKTQREKAAMDAVPASDPRKMISLTYGKEPPKVMFQDSSAPSDEVTIGGHKYYRKASMDAVPASDPRKMISLTYGKEPPKVMFQDSSAPSDEVTIGGHKYYRKASMHQQSPKRNVYEVSRHKKLQQHAMVDRGANGIVSGNDVRVIEYVDEPPVDVGGIDSYRINDVPLATIGAVMMSSIGPIIGIFSQAAHHGKGRTILSSPQLEAFRNIVNDRSKHDTCWRDPANHNTRRYCHSY